MAGASLFAGADWVKFRPCFGRNTSGCSVGGFGNGLPQENAFETVLRDGMAGDTLNPTGLYFGTRNGKLFGTNDGGDSWSSILAGLPPVVCVKTAVA